MADMVRTVLIMSMTGGILALLLFALKPLVRHSLPKSTQYYLWLVVIAALLIPVSRLSLPTNQVPVPNITETVTRFVITQAEETVRLESLAPLSVTNPVVYLEERQAVQSPIALVATYFILVYPFGVLVLLLYYAIHYAIFVGLYRRRNHPAGPGAETLLASMCRGRPPRLYYNALAETPMLFGIFRPAIILPMQEYTHGDMQAILSHELTHLRRKDVLIKWLALLTTAIHWFNPLVWLMRREIDRACELSCDEAIINNMNGHGKRHYGNTLIRVAASPKIPRAITSATMSEDKKNLKERLGAIMKSKRPTKYVVILSALLIFAAIGFVACMGSGREEGPIVGVVDDEPDYYDDYESEEPDYIETEEPIPADIYLRMAPADGDVLATIFAYYEIDFRDAYIAHWDVDLDWLTIQSNAMILANQDLHDFQLIGIYLGHSDYGMTGHMTHVYYHIPVLQVPIVINWFFTAGLFPNNGISFIDSNGVRRFFAIWAGYGYEGAEPFTLREFEDGGYLLRYDDYAEPSVGYGHIAPQIIDRDFSIMVPLIAPEEIILLGILDFEPGDGYILSMSAIEGRNLFVGVTNTPYATRPSGYTWRPGLFRSEQRPSGYMHVTHYGHGYRYLYVGSSVSLQDVTEFPASAFELLYVSVNIMLLPGAARTADGRIDSQYIDGVAIDTLLGRQLDASLLQRLGNYVSDADTYNFDSGLVIGVSGNRIVSISVDFRVANHADFHFSGIGDTSTRDDVIA